MAIKQKVDRAKTDYDEVYAAGKQAEYDAFWDEFQNNGTRTDYAYAFAGRGWGEKSMVPKYDIKPTRAYCMFRDAFSSSDGIDMVSLLESAGIEMDFSNSTDNSYLFHYSAVRRVGVIDISKQQGKATYVFGYCSRLCTIEKLITSETVEYGSIFANAKALENLTIEGVIGKNGFDTSHSVLLSKASIISIINALSTTATGQTATFSQTAVNNAFGGSTSAEWLALVATKPNWTIALA